MRGGQEDRASRNADTATASARYPDAKQIHLDEPNSRIFLPKLGWLRYRKIREIQGRVKNVTVILSCDRWFISIQTEREVPEPVHPYGPETAVGIDQEGVYSRSEAVFTSITFR